MCSDIVGGYSRIITPEKELLELMMPMINFLSQDFGIACAKYRNEKEYSESLGLIFKNSLNEKCEVFIKNIRGEIKMSFDEEEWEAIDDKKLVVKVVTTLKNIAID